jgi:cell division protein FtsL
MIVKVLSTALVVAMVMLFVQVYLNKTVNDEVNLCNFEVDTLEYRVDSIKSEIFVLETQLNRYQIALEMLEDENHQAASEFNKRLSMTE